MCEGEREGRRGGEGRGCWCEEPSARGCNVCRQSRREAFPARSEFRCVRAEKYLQSNRCSFASSGQTANQSPCLSFIRNPASTRTFYPSQFTHLSIPSCPQVSEGLQADESLLDDSDLEARLNRWNLGVSPRAAP